MTPRPPQVPGAGLCNSCRHQQVVAGRSLFTLCLRSRTDRRYPKYPPIPVMRCAGFERRDAPPSGR